jgi:hypothetical protein
VNGWRNPVWPSEIELQSDVSPSDWILPRLLPTVISDAVGTPVGGVVPTGFPAYVRVFHPPGTGGREAPVRWQDVAAANGRIFHPLMQWHLISEPDPEGLGLGVSNPWEGHLESDNCHALYDVLASWTSTPGVCWMGIWEGFGTLYAPSGGAVGLARSRRRRKSAETTTDPDFHAALASWEEAADAVRAAPRFHHPGRDYLLARGSCAAVCLLGSRPLSITPNLVWPEDRAWCVATEIDFDSTLVAATHECAHTLLADDRLEALEVGPADRLDHGGDLINPPA